MDTRYVLLPSDDRSRGEHMIVKEIVSDVRTYRDRDFVTRYFIVLATAHMTLDELNKGIP